MITRSPRLVSHVGGRTVGADVTIPLGFGFADKQAVKIWRISMNAVLRDPSATASWMFTIVNDPRAVFSTWDSGNIFELNSSVLASLLVSTTFDTAVGVNAISARAVEDFGPEGYLTQRDLILGLEEHTGDATLDFSVEIQYSRVDLTADEQTTLVAVRNR